MLKSDEHWMTQALELARYAGELDEVPVGAIVVLGDQIIGSGYNQPISRCDPTAHAEVNALRDAAKNTGNYRLNNATLYVTIEPCSMCAGALVHARIKHLVYGAFEPKAGAVESTSCLLDNSDLNHTVTYKGGVLADHCSDVIKTFFQNKRKR